MNDRRKRGLEKEISRIIGMTLLTEIKNDKIKTILEWNKGGHFSNSDIRVAKSFIWCIENLG